MPPPTIRWGGSATEFKNLPGSRVFKSGGRMGSVKSGIGEEGKMGRKGFGGESTKSGVGEP